MLPSSHTSHPTAKRYSVTLATPGTRQAVTPSAQALAIVRNDEDDDGCRNAIPPCPPPRLHGHLLLNPQTMSTSRISIQRRRPPMPTSTILLRLSELSIKPWSQIRYELDTARRLQKLTGACARHLRLLLAKFTKKSPHFNAQLAYY